MSDSVTLVVCTPQAPQSIRFSRQEYWSGLQCPPPEDLPNPGIEPLSLTSSALAGGFFSTSATWQAQKTSVTLFCIWVLWGKRFPEFFIPEGTSVRQWSKGLKECLGRAIFWPEHPVLRWLYEVWLIVLTFRFCPLSFVLVKRWEGSNYLMSYNTYMVAILFIKCTISTTTHSVDHRGLAG